jgi:hypothetical protein
MTASLRVTADHWARLTEAVLPRDGKEAVAFALCGVSLRSVTTFVVREVVVLPDDAYIDQRVDRVTWRTTALVSLLDRAAAEGLAVLKLHAHPNGYDSFSALDDTSDASLASAVTSWCGDTPYLSGVLLPGGRFLGRVYVDGKRSSLAGVDVIGDDLLFFPRGPRAVPDFAGRTEQVFGAKTLSLLQSLRVAVVGCSGTGSVVIEQLARNAIGHLILVDPDVVEEKNLNRIINATRRDADQRHPKVEVLAEAIERMGLGTHVEPYVADLFTPDVVRAVSSADIIFGCIDTVDARHLLNRIASFYVLPYFDLGVKLEADGEGGIEQVCGSVHYVRPGGGSLLSRGTYTLEDAQAAALRRTDPVEYAKQVREKYIRGANEDRPAVISVNMLIASLAVNDFLARIHSYRHEPNASYAIQRVSLSHDIFIHGPDETTCRVAGCHLGRGDMIPLLNLPDLSEC